MRPVEADSRALDLPEGAVVNDHTGACTQLDMHSGDL